ncbi:polysaccharide biosynthesis tyrosine autokinase [Cellulomonas sp. URHE0023]|uniref:polysaccharide biosynthesis tyrosine autokinase n=1 Tax=Cellulomonas sp. URHE0023 TaxID=1380354 RepID=UPI0006906E00|nr:polysaccharide biosynthesis tyrosine autokinase [Cellulomonas sp. URHE0023]
MSLVDFLTAARKHWFWVLMPVLLLGGMVGYLSSNATPVYRASASMYVALTAGDSASDLNQGSSYTQGQMLSFARLTTLPIVLTPVIEELGLDTSAKRLGHRIVAATPQNTSILTVSATGTDPEATAALANSVAANTADVIESLAPANESGEATVKVTIVDEADPPQNPIAPNTKRNVMAALFAGLLLGLIAAYLREVLDTRVRRPEDVEQAIDVPVVGTLRADKHAVRTGPIEAVLAGGPQAEEIRRIRTNLQMIGRVGVPKSFVFSSAIAGEGKSYTSARVAASFAAAGDRVLLIDADLRRPTIARQLGLEEAVGLTEVLVGRATVQEVYQPVGTSLVVLASGAVPPNPSELLASRDFEELLDWASKEFDTVIIDAPPLLPVADAVVISRMTTGLLLVMDASKVRRAQLRKAVASVRLGGGRIVGSVLNRAKVAASDSYAYEQRASRPKRYRKDKDGARDITPETAWIEWPRTPEDVALAAREEGELSAAPGEAKPSLTPDDAEPSVGRDDVKPAPDDGKTSAAADDATQSVAPDDVKPSVAPGEVPQSGAPRAGEPVAATTPPDASLPPATPQPAVADARTAELRSEPVPGGGGLDEELALSGGDPLGLVDQARERPTDPPEPSKDQLSLPTVRP